MSVSAPLALDTIVFARGLTTPARGGTALAGIDLDILPGEVFSIVGRAGSGKTTLLEALVGLRPFSAEQLLVCGTDPREFPNTVKQRIGVAPGRAALERRMTVGDVLRWFATLYQRADPEAAMQRLQLEPVKDRRVESLDPPLLQRVTLALAIVNDPVVLFADEPTRDLDPSAARLVWDLLRERRERGRTSIVTTNHLDDAARISDRIAVLDRGRLVAADSPSRLVARSPAPQRIVVELPGGGIGEDVLRRLPAVTGIYRDRGAFVISSRAPLTTMGDLVRMLERAGVQPLALGLRQESLEEAFFSLTGQEQAA